jgi:EpsI family protein
MINNKYFSLALVTLLMTAGLVLTVSRRGVPSVIRTNLENLPLGFAGFKGVDDSFSDRVYEVLDADHHVYRHYRSPEVEEVNFYIGYYGTAKGGRTGHNPYACLPGAGWAIIEQDKVEVYPSYRPEGVTLNYVVAKKDGVNNVMLHWYQSAGDQVLSTGLEQNIQRFLGRVFYNRNDGAYVQVSVLTNQEGIGKARTLIKSFAEEILGLLPGYWPVEN